MHAFPAYFFRIRPLQPPPPVARSPATATPSRPGHDVQRRSARKGGIPRRSGTALEGINGCRRSGPSTSDVSAQPAALPPRETRRGRRN
jgi:hypothetical protein